MHAETSRAASVWRPRGLRHIVPWSRVRNHSGGQNVLLVFTVRVFLHDKHPRTLDPLARSWEMTEPDKKGRSAPELARKHGSKPMASSVKDMLAAANSAVPRIQPADLRDRMSKAMLSLSTFVTRLSWLPAARSKAQFTCRAACWSSVPTPKAHTTIPLLGRRRPSSSIAHQRALGTRRKNAARAWLQVGLQCGRLQGFGGSGSGDRASLEALDPPKRSANCLHVPCVRENWRAPNHRG
jgi:hypothetical protein